MPWSSKEKEGYAENTIVVEDPLQLNDEIRDLKVSQIKKRCCSNWPKEPA